MKADPITVRIDGREERFASVGDAAEALKPLVVRYRQDSRQRRDSRIKLGHAALQVVSQAPHGLRDRWLRALAAACELNVHTLKKAVRVAERFANGNGEFDPDRYAAVKAGTPNRITKLLTRSCLNFSGDPNSGPSINELEVLANARAPGYIEPALPECGPAPDGIARELVDGADDGEDEAAQPSVTVLSGPTVVAIAAEPAVSAGAAAGAVPAPKARRPDAVGQAFLASLYEHCGRLTDNIGKVRAMIDRGVVAREVADVMARFDDELARALSGCAGERRTVLALV